MIRSAPKYYMIFAKFQSFQAFHVIFWYMLNQSTPYLVCRNYKYLTYSQSMIASFPAHQQNELSSELVIWRGMASKVESCESDFVCRDWNTINTAIREISGKGAGVSDFQNIQRIVILCWLHSLSNWDRHILGTATRVKPSSSHFLYPLLLWMWQLSFTSFSLPHCIEWGIILGKEEVEKDGEKEKLELKMLGEKGKKETQY